MLDQIWQCSEWFDSVTSVILVFIIVNYISALSTPVQLIWKGRTKISKNYLKTVNILSLKKKGIFFKPELILLLLSLCENKSEVTLPKLVLAPILKPHSSTKRLAS